MAHTKKFDAFVSEGFGAEELQAYSDHLSGRDLPEVEEHDEFGNLLNDVTRVSRVLLSSIEDMKHKEVSEGHKSFLVSEIHDVKQKMMELTSTLLRLKMKGQ